MQQKQGILYLEDPLKPGGKKHISKLKTLVFNENGRYLAQAQTALYALRRECGWVCVAAEGSAAAIALSLAAQLPVDRLALAGDVFSENRTVPLSRELARMKTFARRNLSLIVAETLLIGVSKAQVQMLIRGMPHSRFCLLSGDTGWNRLDAPWECLCENNLLIPVNCV